MVLARALCLACIVACGAAEDVVLLQVHAGVQTGDASSKISPHVGIPALQAMADDPVYDRWSHSDHQPTRLSDATSLGFVPENPLTLVDAPARTLIVDGCSGSTYMLSLSQRLLVAHGVSVHAVGEGGCHKEDLIKHIPKYLTDAEKEKIKDLDLTQSLKLAVEAVQRNNETLFFKTNTQLQSWDPSFQVMGTFFKDTGIKAALVFRNNILDWNVCRIRDCFAGRALGHPVNENGVEDKACFERREDPTLSTWALVNPEKMVSEIKQTEIDRVETLKKLRELGLVTEELYSEDLLSFELSSEGLGRSVKGWKKILSSWGIAASTKIIEEVLTQEPLTGKLPQPGPHSDVIYNIDEVESELRKNGLEHYLRT